MGSVLEIKQYIIKIFLPYDTELIIIKTCYIIKIKQYIIKIFLPLDVGLLVMITFAVGCFFVGCDYFCYLCTGLTIFLVFVN